MAGQYAYCLFRLGRAGEQYAKRRIHQHNGKPDGICALQMVLRKKHGKHAGTDDHDCAVYQVVFV